MINFTYIYVYIKIKRKKNKNLRKLVGWLAHPSFEVPMVG